MQPAIALVGIDLKLFNLLSEGKEPLTVDYLAENTGAAPCLLGRILRYLSSMGFIKETTKDTFTANNITNTLSVPAIQAGVYHNFDTIAPAVLALPDYLIENKYQDITELTNTPMQTAFNTEPAFIWVQTRPESHTNFNQFMEIRHSGKPAWFDVYPIAEKSQNIDSNQVIFVNIGGGISHHTVDAKFYFLSNITHDHPDDKCVTILKNIVSAMGPDSVILINDMVLPNSGAHWHVTQVDLTMMTMLAALERTLEQWYELMEKAGLRINKIYSSATAVTGCD
ncbi:hypothetical protein BDW59DRAFT_170655 [Aspergillus cavernicola]|uniref:O-methyltransferase domain-containing protein n=1 Tax=Aspergillus cavernicola TaxID=176166 RepID=A0ABR4INE0_9EURO